jgi:predicted methyltransferase
MRLTLLAAAATLVATVPLPALAQEAGGTRTVRDALGALDAHAALGEVLAHERRAEDRARDQYRHPGETLEFFQLRPGMTVVDYVPAGGWYTRILVPYLGPEGRYIAMGPDVRLENQRNQEYWGGQDAKVRAQVAEDGLTGAAVSGFSSDAVPEQLAGTVDRVLIFREVHNQLRNGWLHRDLIAIRNILKPDGMLGIVQHRADEDAPFAMRDGSKGYLRERDLIALMDLYGFELVGKSEVNANPRDPKDWPNGVWMLPPNFRGATDETRPRLIEIGESDRMTLLFRKRD